MAYEARPSDPEPPGTGPWPASSAGTRTGVPLSVWPAIPPPGPCPASLPPVPCPQRWPAAAAAVVITALTGPGDLVAALDPAAGVFAAAAAGAGRRALGPAESPSDCDLAAAPGRPARPPARGLAWLRPGGPAALLAGSCPQAGQAALAVVSWCATPGCPPPATADPGVTATRAGEVFAACHRVLSPGGLLAVVTNAACHPGHAGDVTASARAAGLVYTQHIIAVHAVISGTRLRLPAAAVIRPPISRPAGPHRPVHSDVLLFRRPGGPDHG
jgi:hypothetical protein